MKQLFSPRRELLGRLLVCASRALLCALLAGARIFGGYAPFAVGAVAAAGPGWAGLAALMGTGLGALWLLDFPHALRTMACALLLFTANNAFCELRAYQKKYFLPLLTAGMMLAVETVYVLRARSAAEAAYCLITTLLAALFAHCCRLTFAAGRAAPPAAALMVLIGVLTALTSAVQMENGFAPGRIAAEAAVLLLAFDRDASAALTAALCVGLAMDLAAPDTIFLHAACYGFCALLTGALHRGSRVRAALAFALSATLFSLPLESAQGLALLYEGLAGTLLFLLLPARALRAVHEEEDAREKGLRARLREAAAALRELYESVAQEQRRPEENPAVIFDRAAETVCRDCPQRAQCWEREYNRIYTALNDATPALLRSGEGHAEDFPTHFSERCVRFSSFLAAVNAELRAFLLRRQYRVRLDASYTRAAEQYARMSELLSQTAEGVQAGAAVPLLHYRVGLTLRPREGETVSGDCGGTFETDGAQLCLLLADGMGSGEAARRESALAVRLVEKFLRAGIDAHSALKTVNAAMDLRAEQSGGFTTVDLLTLSLKNGEGELCKYGAAPSYIKRGKRVRRVSCACLPAGLAGEAQPPERTQVRLEDGSFFVMVTDGVADSGDDAWLCSLLESWEGDNPQLLVSAILADSYDHRGTADDAGVLALYLPEDGAQSVRAV